MLTLVSLGHFLKTRTPNGEGLEVKGEGGGGEREGKGAVPLTPSLISIIVISYRHIWYMCRSIHFILCHTHNITMAAFK